jgi:hypothetical protein
MFSRLQSGLLVLLLLLAPAPRAADYPIEVIELRHNLLQDVLPVIRPLMGEGETVTGMGSQLVIKAPPARVDQIRQLLTEIDRPPRRLIVTVSNQGDLNRYSRGYSAAADINAGDGNITVNPRGRQRETASAGIGSGDSRARIGVHDATSQGGRTVGQHVQVLEGRRAWINAGVQVPVQTREGYIAGGVPYERRSISYHDVRSGFYVIPRVSGDIVTLEILQHDDRPGDTPRTFRTQSTNTSVSGRLGQWIDLGGIDTAETDSRRDIGQSVRSGVTGTQQISVKVECLDC